MDQQRWAALCSRLGCLQADARFSVLRASYSEAHRHYHTAAHIRDCLNHLDRVAGPARHVDELEFAIWLHDVIYLPLRNDNEERSADIAVAWLRGSPLQGDGIDRVRGLIVATRHEGAAASGDQAILQDIDMAVLGTDPKRYAEYEEQIRKEYRRVPGVIFRSRRAELLEAFLERDAIYLTRWFRERFEESARENLRRSVASLRSQPQE